MWLESIYEISYPLFLVIIIDKTQGDSILLFIIWRGNPEVNPSILIGQLLDLSFAVWIASPALKRS